MKYTVAVTSGTRATGKTTSVAVLGAVFADAGADVLLVDCDLADPSLAAALGIPEPGVTLRDVFAGRATLDEAVHTGPAGAEVLPGGRFAVPDAAAIQDFVEAIDGFDVVVCDTGDPFSDATAGACDAADGAVVVSTPDDAARRNAAAVHGSLREHGRQLLGTVLTRSQGDADTPKWDCDILATIPESDAVASGAMAVLDSPSDPGAERYRELARGVYRRLRDSHDGTASNAALWLPQPADPFLTPAVAAGTSGDTDMPSNDELGEPESAAGDDTASDAVADGGNGSTGDTNDSTVEADTPAEKPIEDDDSGITLTRRGALAALTAAVGGVSAGILNTRETPEIEAFGYGGRPVTSNESTTSTTNTTTSAGSLSTGGSNRTGPTTETETGDTERGNETGTEGTGNSTQPVSTGNTTESGGVGNTTDPVSTGNTTDTNDEPAPGAEPTNETSDTEESPTSGDDSGGTTGGSGTGDSTGSDGGSTEGGDTGTSDDGNTGSGDTGTSDDGNTGSGDTGTSDDGNTGSGDTGTSDDGNTGGDDSGTGDDGTGSDDGDTGTGSDGNTEDGDTGTGSDENTEDGDTGTGDDGNTEDSDTGTGGDGTDSDDGGDGTDDTTDAPSDPGDEPFGTVGYGEGGYGGVA
ncbi:hypothetical protein PM035_14635 [Halorubrum ezzemoulense]|uniref:MinD/ParA family ATP-binding protein n=1 Tax=Halorubrum ezzemoulense TaxID=337243 RepID=UPI002331014A|nr:hypothetical protein [Halorubrum ezzemoulense]MDB2262065.1 hypothetical protein [Halorubrum ezzemoulense]MDB2268912.1 hypothetical protein [Halorubrum ezzemoulense]